MNEERKRILKMVEEGKLSAAEALLLINKLEEEYEQKKADKLTELSVEVLTTSEQKKDKGKKSTKVSGFAHKLMDLVETAVKKVKDLDFDFHLGQSVSFSHIFQLQMADVNELYVHIVNGSVNIQPWEEEDIRVECDIKAFNTEDMESAREMFLQNTQCQIEGNRFVFFTDKKMLKVSITLYVPNKMYTQYKIKLFNGPIRGEQLKVENLKAKTANGVISFKNIEGKNAEVETANGQIKLNQFSFEKVELETINGLIDVNGIAEKMDVQSFNGNLLLTISDTSIHTLYAKTTTGNIDFKIPEQLMTNGEFKTHLGSFNFDEEKVSILKERNDVLQKELSFQTKGEGKLMLFAESKTGSISLKS